MKNISRNNKMIKIISQYSGESFNIELKGGEESLKELLGTNYRPKDTFNSAADELSDMASFIRKNMKSQLAKQMTD